MQWPCWESLVTHCEWRRTPHHFLFRTADSQVKKKKNPRCYYTTELKLGSLTCLNIYPTLLVTPQKCKHSQANYHILENSWTQLVPSSFCSWWIKEQRSASLSLKGWQWGFEPLQSMGGWSLWQWPSCATVGERHGEEARDKTLAGLCFMHPYKTLLMDTDIWISYNYLVSWNNTQKPSSACRPLRNTLWLDLACRFACPLPWAALSSRACSVMECSCLHLQWIVASHVWLLSTWNAASATEELSFYYYALKIFF